MPLRIPVVSLGGQYNHLISRALSELGAESFLIPMSVTLKEVEEIGADGLVFGGGPQRIHEAFREGGLGSLPALLKEVELPSLCICAAHQLLALVHGGEVGPAARPEFGPAKIEVLEEDVILGGLKPSFVAWESHNDEVKALPEGFRLLARSENCPIQAMEREGKMVFGIQFHPEVYHTRDGGKIFENFMAAVKR
ncbi:TPA: glutamine-hydrolyzing GMP synthase [Candidatus Bathyarchaeota archaeon]|nr:glutamine-hydrolyzing GMP synthase [Candidatus Bathyarchaeota archaeon]